MAWRFTSGRPYTARARSSGAGSPVWASGTVGNDGASLVVHNDGNVVIYSASGAALWATGTNGK